MLGRILHRRNCGSKRGGDGDGDGSSSPSSGFHLHGTMFHPPHGRMLRRNCGSKGPYECGSDGYGDGGARATLSSGLRRRCNGGDQGPHERGGDGRKGLTWSSGGRCWDLMRPPAKAAVEWAPAWMERLSGSTLCKKEELKKEAFLKETPEPSPLPNSSLTINPSEETEIAPYGGDFYNSKKWEEPVTPHQQSMISAQQLPQHQLLQEKQQEQSQLQRSSYQTQQNTTIKNQLQLSQQQLACTPVSMVKKPGSPAYELAAQIDPNENLDSEVEDALIAITDDLVEPLQLFVKACGVSISMQEDIHSTTVEALIMSSCQRIRVNNHGMYAVWHGKVLDSDKFLSIYPIVRNTTIEIRSRLRAGQELSFDQRFTVDNVNDLFETVLLPASLVKHGFQAPGTPAKFFSRKSAFNIRMILMHVTAVHRAGWSYNGKFNSWDILFHDGTVRFSYGIALVPFDGDSCTNDYAKLYEIFDNKFSPLGYPLYFKHLQDYLKKCPAKDLSNTEALIAFVTNHPCLQTYVDRMKQIMILHIMLSKHLADLPSNVAAMGTLQGWRIAFSGVQEMDAIYNRLSLINGFRVTNPLYTDTPKGCLHFGNNYMKHASTQVNEREMEAAFSLHLESFLPETFRGLATTNKQYIIDLLANPLADANTGN